MDLGPCCPRSTEGVSYIYVKGTPIGITGLCAAVDEVKALGLEDIDRIKEELIQRIRADNYIPKGVEEDYKNALLVVYNRKDDEGK